MSDERKFKAGDVVRVGAQWRHPLGYIAIDGRPKIPDGQPFIVTRVYSNNGFDIKTFDGLTVPSRGMHAFELDAFLTEVVKQKKRKELETDVGSRDDH